MIEVSGVKAASRTPMPHSYNQAEVSLILRALETAEFPFAVFDAREKLVFTTDGYRRRISKGEGVPPELRSPFQASEVEATGYRLELRAVEGSEGKKIGTVLTLVPAEFPEFLEELASHVAHEIRNPLGTIAGFATLLEREFPAGDRRAKWVRRIVDAVARLDRMVAQLYLYVHPVRSHPRPLNLCECTKEAFSFAEIKFAAHEAHVTFRYELPDPPVYALVDPQWWQEVVMILCSNAVEAMRNGGEVIVRIEEDGGSARVVIADSGTGIPEEMRNRLFWPFFSSKPDGTGLGLAVARKLLHSMGASIELSGAQGSGTTVTITFAAV